MTTFIARPGLPFLFAQDGQGARDALAAQQPGALPDRIPGAVLDRLRAADDQDLGEARGFPWFEPRRAL